MYVEFEFDRWAKQIPFKRKTNQEEKQERVNDTL